MIGNVWTTRKMCLHLSLFNTKSIVMKIQSECIPESPYYFTILKDDNNIIELLHRQDILVGFDSFNFFLSILDCSFDCRSN